MNNVFVSTPCGLSFSFRSGASSFLSNVLIAVEELARRGVFVSASELGREFKVSVR